MDLARTLTQNIIKSERKKRYEVSPSIFNILAFDLMEATLDDFFTTFHRDDVDYVAYAEKFGVDLLYNFKNANLIYKGLQLDYQKKIAFSHFFPKILRINATNFKFKTALKVNL